jgi:transcription-repair coupling factor (superfamily II helicase)
VIEEIKSEIFNTESFRELSKISETLTKDSQLTIQNVFGSLTVFAAVKIYENRSQVLLITTDKDTAEKTYDDCSLLTGGHDVCLFGERPAKDVEILDISSPISQIETLKALTTNSKNLVVATPYSILSKLPQPGSFQKNILELHTDKHYDFQRLLQQLEEMNFERKDFVETCGDFAVRGGIVDVFPFVGSNPVRLEFFGNTIESIREFDVLSQRSIRELQSASIVPDFAKSSDNSSNNNSASIFDYLSEDAIVILHEPEIIKKEIEELQQEEIQDIFDLDFFNSIISNFATILLSPIDKSSTRNLNYNLNFSSSPQPSFNGSVNQVLEKIGQLSEEGFGTYINCDSKTESKRLESLIDEVFSKPETLDRRRTDAEYPTPNIPHRTSNFQITTDAVHSGFIFPEAKIAVLTEHEIFGRLKRRSSSKYRKFKGISFKEVSQLKRGDYITHIDHGIGKFVGLQKIKVAGAEQEVLKLEYLDKDALYVNLNYVNRVQKYSSQEGHIPKLHKLGEGSWDRLKQKAKRKIKDIARDLIRLYAKRKNEKGFGFSPDSHWQKELEASFMYEDTPDQSKTTEDIKRDMESSSPMDRLICGDVGFGKTEVAVRAAFKAVMDNKQAAILVPTTILAQQHYNTFRDRLDRYSVKVESISRFKTPNEKKSIVEKLKNGQIDIIIGTHRLLSKDIIFKDLGLLIIDEEHRFGVSAKEKLRMLKLAVDTLTLTATPIPRTLNFSLMGARDLSLINTPPQNRLPIITEIVLAEEGRKTHWRIIREAILKELHRGGQVYFVHDRVHNIDEICSLIHEHVPEAKAHVAHGQMHGHDLEQIMLDFLEKKYNVLVATKIIESGLDIPNVNTIIINRADKFGLAELYQLRGRVGRSNAQAYAYLLVPPLSSMPRHSIRRIQAIEEFTELGSGFNLAMRDMEIRGAGNLLGAEQSGYIMEMGFETYEKILSEAVSELKDEEFKELFAEEISVQKIAETTVETDIEAFLPDFYIEKDSERLEIYRRLYRMDDGSLIDEIRLELRDRFGEYPPEVENLFKVIELKIAASKFRIQKVELKREIITVTLPKKDDKLFYDEADDSPLNRLISKIQTTQHLKPKLNEVHNQLQLSISIPKSKIDTDRIKETTQIIKDIFN